MLRIVQIGTGIPASFLCDPSATFQPGQIAQLTVIGNQVMATVSDGRAPIGIIDEIRTKSFTSVSWNETLIVYVNNPVSNNGVLVSPIDIKQELDKPNVVKGSFVSTVPVSINLNNGVVTFPAGTPLNFDSSGSGTPDSIKAVVNYTYYVANIPGDDSTQGSGKMTVWYDRMFFQTDQFETNQSYPVNAQLYVSEYGFLTTRKPSEFHPAIGMVTAPPSPLHSFLEAQWY